MNNGARGKDELVGVIEGERDREGKKSKSREELKSKN